MKLERGLLPVWWWQPNQPLVSLSKVPFGSEWEKREKENGQCEPSSSSICVVGLWFWRLGWDLCIPPLEKCHVAQWNQISMTRWHVLFRGKRGPHDGREKIPHSQTTERANYAQLHLWSFSSLAQGCSTLSYIYIYIYEII